MNKRLLGEYQQIAQRVGLAADPETGVIHGTKDGYAVLLYAPNANAPRILQLLVAARRDQPLDKEESRALQKSCGAVRAVAQRGNLLAVDLKGGMLQKTIEGAAQALEAALEFARRGGFTPCCQNCGRPVEAGAVNLGGSYALLCDECFSEAGQAAQMELQQKNARGENLVGGIVGALLGSLVGGASIVLLSQLGYIAVLSGILMGVCTVKGYELLAGRMSKKGAAISLVVMLLMTWFADRLDWAIVISRELEAGLFESYRAVGELMALGAIETGAYYGNLALVYLFVLVGAVPVLYGALKNNLHGAQIYRMGDSSRQQPQL